MPSRRREERRRSERKASLVNGGQVPAGIEEAHENDGKITVDSSRRGY
jgi:hypothetical protein